MQARIGIYVPLIACLFFAALSLWVFARLASLEKPEPLPNHVHESLEAWQTGAEALPDPDVIADRMSSLLRLIQSYEEVIAELRTLPLWLGLGFLVVGALEVRNVLLLRKRTPPVA